MDRQRKIEVTVTLDLDTDLYDRTYGVGGNGEAILTDAVSYAQGFVSSWLRDRLDAVDNGIQCATVSARLL